MSVFPAPLTAYALDLMIGGHTDFGHDARRDLAYVRTSLGRHTVTPSPIQPHEDEPEVVVSPWDHAMHSAGEPEPVLRVSLEDYDRLERELERDPETNEALAAAMRRHPAGRALQ